MSGEVKPRVRVPSAAAAGEAVVIKTLISHRMETGLRRDADDNPIPRQIINRFTCEFNGETVIDVAIEPAVSTNPYFEFEAIAPEAGEFVFKWYDDNGEVYETSKAIKIG